MRIGDLTDCLFEKHLKSHPLLTLRTHKERLQSITEQGYGVLYDPSADRNCRFCAATYALSHFKIFRSAVILRNEVIYYFNSNDISLDGFLMELFAGIP